MDNKKWDCTTCVYYQKKLDDKGKEFAYCGRSIGPHGEISPFLKLNGGKNYDCYENIKKWHNKKLRNCLIFLVISFVSLVCFYHNTFIFVISIFMGTIGILLLIIRISDFGNNIEEEFF